MSDDRAYSHLTERLDQGRRRFIAQLSCASMLRFAAWFTLLVFALLVLGIVLSRVPEAPQVLAALALGGAITLFGLCVVRPLLGSPALKPFALMAEDRFPESRALLVNALELVPQAHAPGAGGAARTGRAAATSRDLVLALAEEASRRVDRLDLKALAPPAVPRKVALLLAAAAGLWDAGFALWPGPFGDSLERLLHPRAAAATLVRIVVEPGDITVPPGATLHVRADVSGTSRKPALVFTRGGKNERVTMDRSDDVAGSAGASGSGDARRFEGVVRGIAAPGTYWVEAAGVRSPLYAVSLAGEAGIVSFDFTFRYPGYTRLPAETQSATRGDVTALVGTRVQVVVNLDRHAARARWTLPGREAAPLAALSPRRYNGEFTVSAEGVYTVEVETEGRVIRETYRIQPVADQPPLLTVIEPQNDLDLPNGQRIPLWAAVSDDYGVSDLTLVYKRADEAARRGSVARWPDHPREASAGTDWDASVLALVPGQSATFHLELRDNDAVRGPNVTVSRTFTVRFPLLSELYDELEEEKKETQDELERTAREAKELAKQVEDLAKSLQNDTKLTWEKKEAARELSEQQKQLAEKLAQEAKALADQAEKASEQGADNEQLLSKMQELSKIVSEIKNEDLRRAMEELSKRLEQTDPRQLQDQLKDLAQAQKEMLEGLERSIELMKKIRQEEKMHEAAERAKELAEQQKNLNERMENRPPESPERAQRMAGEQQKLEEQAKELGQELEELAKEMAAQEQEKAAAPMERGAEKLEQEITPQMQQSEEGMRQSPHNKSAQSKAQKSGRQAQKGLEQLSQSLDQAANESSGEQDDAVADAIRRSAQDLVNLSQAGEEALQQPGEDRERAARQEDLKEGTQQVAEDLIETGKDTPYLSPKAVQELGRAMNELERSRDAFTQGNQAQGRQAGEQAGAALDRAVLALREAEAACQSPGSKPGGEKGSSREKMQGLAGQQGELNQETRSLAERLTRQQRLMAGDQATHERLAAEQEAIRKGLEEATQNAKPEEGLLGRMDQAKEDMKEVEKLLERGRLDDDTLARQQKILSRMLDAQRSLNRRDFEEQRESRTGREIARPSPADLRADLMTKDDRLRYDLLRAQAEKYPTEYRALVEAYLRKLGETE